MSKFFVISVHSKPPMKHLYFEENTCAFSRQDKLLRILEKTG